MSAVQQWHREMAQTWRWQTSEDKQVRLPCISEPLTACGYFDLDGELVIDCVLWRDSDVLECLDEDEVNRVYEQWRLQ